jgi:ribonuclease HI
LFLQPRRRRRNGNPHAKNEQQRQGVSSHPFLQKCSSIANFEIIQWQPAMSGKRRANYYAVRVGHQPGLYRSWEECEASVKGYSGAVFKGFATRSEAEAFLNLGRVDPVAVKPIPKPVKPAVESVPVPPLLTSFVPTNSAPANGRKKIVIYADGACTGNPGPGGYGAVILYAGSRKELSAGFRYTTNNRMEILGCIAALSALREPCDVTIYSDSRYVVNAMTKSWALRWRKNNWQRREKTGEMKAALNSDLWAQMLELCAKHRVRFEWVRGHDGVEENERCDQLARSAAAGHGLGIDVVFESPKVT